MKQHLRIIGLIFLIFSAIKTQAQLTNLSNNTNIRFGIPLGNIGVMADKNGALWRTNGTSGGTVIYTSKVLLDSTAYPVVLNNKIYFSGITAASGKELWVTDGTDGGTLQVKDIYAGATGSVPRNLFVFNNNVYFFAKTTADGVELWKSDGTSAGTSEVKDINPGSGNSYNSTYTSFFTNNNILYFDAYDGTHGIEIWKTDGTSAGTVLLKDIDAGADSSLADNFTAYGTSVIFSAKDATHGTELWKTDGTSAGTVLISDIVSGANSSSPSEFVPFLGKVFFVTTSPGILIPTYNLYSTDGNSATLVKAFGLAEVPILELSVVINNKLFFTGSDLTHGVELWSTDGTGNGTGLFDDINPGTESSSAFFLPDINAYLNSGNYHTTLFNGKAFLIANDGTHGNELWITDGTKAGTKLVKDIYPGSASSIDTIGDEYSLSYYYTANTFYFSAFNNTVGTELYQTDGTTANTALVENLNPGAGNADPFIFMAVNNHLYLTADNGDNANGDRDLYILNASVVLPVKLLNFAAVLDNKAVDLDWATSSELNTKTYTVQRSTNGTQFNSIGSLNAAGISNEKKSYQFIDNTALSTNSTKLYYRLMITDNDGKGTYSNVATVTLGANGGAISIYPNPVKDQLFFSTSTNINTGAVKITNQDGKIVYNKQFESLQPGASNKINISNLSKGVYYFELVTDNGKQTAKFIKY